MQLRPTLHDVARAAGVSHMTVSRVVRRERSVSLKTAAHVKAVIEKLGYHPDPALSALAAYRSNQGGKSERSVIAFLDCDGTSYSRVMLSGAQAEAAALGYRVERFSLENDAAQRRISRMLFHRGIEGLLFGPSDEPRAFTGWDWEHFAPVSLGALHHEPPMHTVGMDYFHGLQLAFDALIQKGCHRIGFVLDRRLEARTGHLWLGAYAARERRIPPFLFVPEESPEKKLQKWITTHRLDGALTIHDQFHRAFLSAKIVVGYLNDSTSASNASRVSLDPATVGAEGIRVLHHLLLRRETGLPAQPKTVLLRGIWKSS